MRNKNIFNITDVLCRLVIGRIASNICIGLLLYCIVAVKGFQSDFPEVRGASLIPCAPKSLPAAGKIGKCVDLENMDEQCSKGELSASMDCSNDAWCCYDPKTVLKSLTKPKQSTVQSNTSCVPTAADDIGPYYVNGAPVYTPTANQTVWLCPNGFRDDRVLLSGYIRFRSDNVSCGVGKRALVDMWMANQTGWYSIVPPALQNPTPSFFQNADPFTLATNATSVSDPDWFCRLKIITGDDGYYSISTVIPGRYEILAGWRPAHMHFRIFQLDQYNKPIGKDFITQLYFNYDMFRPTDTCPVCKAMDPTITITYSNTNDFKTFEGKMDFLINV